MHELQVTNRILQLALEHASRGRADRILVIHLRVGELCHLEKDWLQHYFDYLSKGTLAENARLEIEWAPIVLQCNACGFSFEVTREELGVAECTSCGEARCKLVSGQGYLVENMEVI
jgi:hydrogenase nickel incorporation protein HypA/HybF